MAVWSLIAAKCQQGGCRKGAMQRRSLCQALSQKASLGALVTREAAELSGAGVGLWKVESMFMDPEGHEGDTGGIGSCLLSV